MWRLAESLVVLRNQLNAAYPNRSRASDGGIGDAAHQAQGSASDHNPWFKDGNGVGVVTAFDFTHDPDNGVDIDKLSDILTSSRDPRIKYLVANGLILIPFQQPWASEYGWHWQDYEGDPHVSHLHISVNTNDYDNTNPWNIGDEDMKPATYEEANIYAQTILLRDMPRSEWEKFHKGKTHRQLFDEFRLAAERAKNLQALIDMGATRSREDLKELFKLATDQIKEINKLKEGVLK